MVEKTIVLNADTKEAEKNVDSFNEGLKETDKSTKKLNKDLKETKGDLSGVTSMADKATGGLISGFTGSLTAIKSVVKGFKTLKFAIISTGIGALVIVVSSLIAAFKSSEEGANKFSKILGIIGTFTDNLIDRLADLGEAIISAFENPKKTLKSFVKSFENLVIRKFEAFLESIGLIGSALKKVFSLDFDAALEDASKGFSKLNEEFNVLAITAKAVGEATKELIKEDIDEAKRAAKVADDRAKALKLERELLVERSVLENKIAQLRLKSRQEEQFSAAERKQALLDAQKLEEGLLAKETEVLVLRRDAQVEENTFARSNITNLDKEAQAIAAVNRQSALRLNQQRTTQRELNTLNKQIQAEEKKRATEKQKIIDDEQKATQAAIDLEAQRIRLLSDSEANLLIEQKKFNAKSIENELDRLKELQSIDKLEEKIQLGRLQKTIDLAKKGTKERTTAIINFNKAKQKFEQQEITRAKEIEAVKSKLQDEELAKEKQQQDLLNQLKNDAQQQEIAKLIEQYDAKFQLALGNIELEKALEEQKQIDLKAIRDKYDAIAKEEKDKEDEEKKAKRDADIQFTVDTLTQAADVISQFAQMNQEKFEALNAGVIEQQEELSQKILDNENLTNKQKEQQIAQLNAVKQRELDANNKRAEKAFKVQQAASIASALASTYLAAVQAYQSQFVPIPDPSSPIRGGIAAGLAVAAGLANVAQIKKQKFEAASFAPIQVPSQSVSSGGAGGGGGAGTSPSQAPQFNVVGQSGFNQVAGALGQQGPVQAFVVSGDVTTAQELENNTITQATF